MGEKEKKLIRGNDCPTNVRDLRAYRHDVTPDFIRPGKPTDNAFTETFF